MKILTLVLKKYQDLELNTFLAVINRSGKLSKKSFYNPNDENNIFGSNNIGSIEVENDLNNLNIDEYDLLYIPGGPAAQEIRTNFKTHEIIKLFIEKKKFIVAHCDAPNALYKIGFFKNKKYVSYPPSDLDEINSPLRIKDNSLVFVDGNYISGKSPGASIALGLKVIEVFYGLDESEKIKSALMGNENE